MVCDLIAMDERARVRVKSPGVTDVTPLISTRPDLTGELDRYGTSYLHEGSQAGGRHCSWQSIYGLRPAGQEIHVDARAAVKVGIDRSSTG